MRNFVEKLIEKIDKCTKFDNTIPVINDYAVQVYDGQGIINISSRYILSINKMNTHAYKDIELLTNEYNALKEAISRFQKRATIAIENLEHPVFY